MKKPLLRGVAFWEHLYSLDQEQKISSNVAIPDDLNNAFLNAKVLGILLPHFRAV
jgi:hypothetical protein